MSDKNEDKDSNISENEEFQVKEDEEEHEEPKNLNKNLSRYIPTIILKSLLTIGVVIGFLIGYIVGALATSSLVCGLEILSQVTADLTGGFAEQDGGTDNMVSELTDQFTACVSARFLTPIPILAGLIGGIFTGYPSYKLLKTLSEKKYIRSII